jgi:hypothetical protein
MLLDAWTQFYNSILFFETVSYVKLTARSWYRNGTLNQKTWSWDKRAKDCLFFQTIMKN